MAWRRPSECSDAACVEVELHEEWVNVRMSVDPHGDILTFTKDEWVAFIDGVKNGEFDP